MKTNICVINAIQTVRNNTVKKTNSVYTVFVRLEAGRITLNSVRNDYYNNEYIKSEPYETSEEISADWDMLIHNMGLGKFEESMFASRVLREVGARCVFDSINVTLFE